MECDAAPRADRETSARAGKSSENQDLSPLRNPAFVRRKDGIIWVDLGCFRKGISEQGVGEYAMQYENRGWVVPCPEGRI